MSHSGFCTRCGSALAATDAFCRRCGTVRYPRSNASAGGDSAPHNPSATRNFRTAPTASKPAASLVALAVLVASVLLAVTVWIGAGYFSSLRYSSPNFMAGGSDNFGATQNQGGSQLPLERNSAGPSTTTISIPANQPWTDTGISVTGGQSVSISASGSIYIGALSNPSLDYESPQGNGVVFANGYGCSVNPRTRFPHIAPGLACWSLIGKIGANGAPFQVGAGVQFSAAASGELYLGVNDNVFGDNRGSWTATVTTIGMRPVPRAQTNANIAPRLPSAAEVTACLSDDFAGDSSLNPQLWQPYGDLLARLAIATSDVPQRFVPAYLSFSPSGLTMAGVDGTYQFTGIQSVSVYSAPLSVEVEVTGLEAHGNAFVLYLVNDTLSEYLTMNGNLNPGNGPYYSVWVASTGLGHISGFDGNEFAREVRVMTPYLLYVAVDAFGSAAASVLTLDGSLVGHLHLRVGQGPFHIVLAQREGLPYTIGRNRALWHHVKVFCGTGAQAQPQLLH
ncbi:hypothetical protein [Candidatus Binatus sp.]|jgi:hypothetical protein